MEVKFETQDGKEMVFYGVTDFEPLDSDADADYVLYAPRDHEIDSKEVTGAVTQVIDSAHIPHGEVPYPKDGDVIHDWRTEGYYARLGGRDHA